MLTILAGIALAVTLGPIAPDAPAREPQMAAKESMVALTFGAARGIYFSKSSDSGKSFCAPVKIAEAEIIPLTRHRGPHLVFTKQAIVISAVVGWTLAEGAHAHGLPSDGDLVAWRSDDGGVNWSKGITINDIPGAATEGLHSLAADARGNLFTVWLDRRGGKVLRFMVRARPMMAAPGRRMCGSISRLKGRSARAAIHPSQSILPGKSQ